MKNLIFVFALLLIVSVSASAQKKKTPPVTADEVANEKAVRQVFEDLLNGIRNSNVDAVTNIYWKSPQTIYFNNNGSTTIGWEQDRKNREARYPRISNVKLEVKEVRLTMLGKESALITCLWSQTQDFETVAESASGRMTLVFRRIEKNWKVIHLHTSPDLPKTDRPVFPSEKTEKPEKLEKPLPLVTPTPKKVS
jgi:ketosteroid isomerase-like protein